MTPADAIALRCKISQGAFSGEMIFRVSLQGEEEYVGAAPPEYCYTAQAEPLVPEQLASGQTVTGLIETRLIKEKPGGVFWLKFPTASF